MAKVVEERWHCDAESKRILDNFLAECKEEEERQVKKQEHKEVLSRANISHTPEYNELLLKYLQLKDYLRDCYPEIWKEFMNGTETKMS